MIYRLRINNHRRDHGGLIVEALLPAIRIEWQANADLRVAAQPHWLHGPHLALGVEGPGEDRALARLRGAVLSWMSGKAPVSIDQAAYAGEQKNLAEIEGVAAPWEGLRRDLTVEIGDHTPPAPRGDHRLASLRDDFRAATLETAAELVKLRLVSTGSAIAAFARLFTALEHVRFAVPGNPWPLSPRGQAESAKAMLSSPKAQAAVAAVEEDLEQQVAREGLLTDSGSWDAHFIGTLQKAHDDALAFAIGNSARIADWAEAETSHVEGEPAGMDRKRWRDVLSNPAHFAYRFTVNHLYDMQPLVGLSTVHRAIACTALARLCDRNAAIDSRAYRAGVAF